MDRGFIEPPVFKGLPVGAAFTMKTFYVDDGVLKTQLKGETVYLPVQKHTDKVIVVGHDTERKIADAVVTNAKGLIIGIRTADCVPILLYDRKRHVAGAVHAGWRGTAEGIVKKTIAAMRDRFYSSPEDVIVAIGPSIKGRCYEVGPEVAQAVAVATGGGQHVLSCGERLFVDLPSANKIQAMSEGIHPDDVWISEDCTHCHPEKYYSYRYARGTTGRQYGFIVIR